MRTTPPARDRLRGLFLRSVSLALFSAATATVASGQGVVITPIGSGNRSDRAYTATLLPSGGVFVAGQTQGAIATIHGAAVYSLDPAVGPPTAILTTKYYPDNTSANADYAGSSVLVGNDVVTAGVAYTSNKTLTFRGNFALTWWNASGAYRKVETVFTPDRKGLPTTKSRAVEILRAADGTLIAVGEDHSPGRRLAYARYNAGTGALLTKTLTTLEFEPRGAALKGNAVLAVGKLLTTGHMAVVRLNGNGKLDTSWGAAGVLEIPVGGDSQAEAVAIDAAGKILIAGSAAFEDREAVLVRLNADGSPDPAFGEQGLVRADLGGTEDTFTAVNLRANGLIVATGTTSSYDGIYQKASFAAAQFGDDGSPDVDHFGVDGVTVVPIAESALCHDARIQPDGRIVLVGEARTLVQVSPRLTNLDFAVVQLDLAGNP